MNIVVSMMKELVLARAVWRFTAGTMWTLLTLGEKGPETIDWQPTAFYTKARAANALKRSKLVEGMKKTVRPFRSRRRRRASKQAKECLF